MVRKVTQAEADAKAGWQHGLMMALASTNRKDETALAARIDALVQAVLVLTERVNGLDARLRS